MENEEFEKKIDETEISADNGAYQKVRDAGAETASETAAEAVSEEAEAAEGEKSKSKLSGLLGWVKDIAIAIVIAFLITRVISPTIVQEHSMDDTLHHNDYLILYKLAYSFGGEPEYGDIVVFKSSLLDDSGDEKLLIKRVIGVGGDTVAVRDGVVYRNGEPLAETYTRDNYTNGGMDETVVPEGELFLLGDNRMVSLDSRDPSVGFVDEDTIVGKAVLRLYPFNQIGGLYDNYNQAEVE